MPDGILTKRRHAVLKLILDWTAADAAYALFS